MQKAPQRAAFLDRDGVINVDTGYVYQREAFEWVPGALEGARRLHELGFALVVVTNQSGIGRGYYSEADFHRLTKWMAGEFERAGAPLSGVYFCPHHPEKALPEYRQVCCCRKPAPGMLQQAAKELGLDLSRSIMFGDKPGDCEAGRAAGCPERVLLATNGAGSADQSKAPAATRAAATLLEAVQSPWLQAFARQSS